MSFAPNAPPPPGDGGGPVLPPYSEHPKQNPGYPMPYGAPQANNYPQFPPGPQPQPYPYPQPYPAPNQVPYAPNQAPYGQPQPGYGQQAFYPPAPGPPAPVITQPGPAGGAEWMPMQPQMQRNTNCPPGLEYLTAIDQLLVHQKVELLEAFTGFETGNKYTVKNSMGQNVFKAKEESDCCSRQFCGPMRSFGMKIVDNNGTEVMHLNRPLACASCCFPCCLQNMEVTAPPGTPIGSIQQEWSIFKPKFSVKDASGETVLMIEGPLCTFSMCGDVEFNVLSRDGSTKVGKISKQWSGFVREAFTDADMFGINFPLDLDVKMKAVMLGACFLIDFMFFEKAGNEERDRPGMF